VVCQCTGGNDGLNMVVPYSNSNYYQLRPTLGIAQDKVLHLNEDLGLHPTMTGLHDLYQKGQVAIVQNVDSEKGTIKVSIERPPNAPPLSGNGALVTLLVQPGVKKGESVLRVTDFRLRDAQQNVLVGRAAETRVTTPEE